MAPLYSLHDDRCLSLVDVYYSSGEAGDYEFRYTTPPPFCLSSRMRTCAISSREAIPFSDMEGSASRALQSCSLMGVFEINNGSWEHQRPQASMGQMHFTIK